MSLSKEVGGFIGTFIVTFIAGTNDSMTGVSLHDLMTTQPHYYRGWKAAATVVIADS